MTPKIVLCRTDEDEIAEESWFVGFLVDCQVGVAVLLYCDSLLQPIDILSGQKSV